MPQHLLVILITLIPNPRTDPRAVLETEAPDLSELLFRLRWRCAACPTAPERHPDLAALLAAL
jgi:hypothetical protein